MADPRIIRACRFCGETEHLHMTASGFERAVVFDFVTVIMPDGSELTETVDGVGCEVCDALAPLDVWNGTRSQADYVALRNFDPPAEQVAA